MKARENWRNFKIFGGRKILYWKNRKN